MRIILIVLIVTSSLSAQERSIHWSKPNNYLSYAPLTTHYFRSDIAVTHLMSINYGRIEAGFFVNSYRDPTIAICYKTEVYNRKNTSIHMMAGTAYGYKKQLYQYPTIPLSETILFKTDFVPVGGITVEQVLYKRLALKATFIPLVGGVGLQYQI
jgi:hypothetical protein